MANPLSPAMTLRQFANGYWYAEELRIPHGRYINFVAEFLGAQKGTTRAEVIAAWKELKTLDAPKDCASWVKVRAKRKR